MGESLAAQLATLGDDEVAKRIALLSEAELKALAFDWRFWGRPEQHEPTDLSWHVWLCLAGRGWGKTRTGAETVREWSREVAHGILAGPTAADVRDIMLEGESGIMAVCPPWERPSYEPSKRRLTFKNGSRWTLLSADEPERFRGMQCQRFWADELASWRYEDAWHQLMFGLRLGTRPRGIVTTTPKPRKLIKDLLKRPTTHITKGTTYDNAANLAKQFLDEIIQTYEGTTLGRQEIYAEILDEVAGALWNRGLLEQYRVERLPSGIDVVRTGVAIDPAVTAKKNSDETGIVAGIKGDDDHLYIVEDASVSQASPNTWGRKGVAVYNRWEADRIIGEVNNGGDMVETIIRNIEPNISYKEVRASKGKYARAEPVANLYERGLVHHVGMFPELEEQMCTWTPEMDWSPDRMDALVWLATELMLGAAGTPRFLRL